MSGLAVWDDRTGALGLARGRAGEKPLFWSERGGALRFASAIQPLLAFPDQPRRVHRPAAELYAALGYVPAPQPMFAGIEKLRPGELLVANAQGVTRRRYWDPAVVASQPSRLTSPAALRETLLAAVERELMSDVPGGLFTHGGRPLSFPRAAPPPQQPGAPDAPLTS